MTHQLILVTFIDGTYLLGRLVEETEFTYMVHAVATNRFHMSGKYKTRAVSYNKQQSSWPQQSYQAHKL